MSAPAVARIEQAAWRDLPSVSPLFERLGAGSLDCPRRRCEACHGDKRCSAAADDEWWWTDIAGDLEHPSGGFGVVVREVAHVRDMLDGGMHGIPMLSQSIDRSLAVVTRSAARAERVIRIDSGEPTWIDPYAAEFPEAFFSLASDIQFAAPCAAAGHFEAGCRSARARLPGRTGLHAMTGDATGAATMRLASLAGDQPAG